MKSTSKIALFSLVAALAVAGSPGASAQLLFSNLNQTVAGPNNLNSGNNRLATEFRTGAAASTLTGLSLRVFNGDNVAHDFNAYLYADPSNLPGTLLATFTDVSPAVPGSTFDFLTAFSLPGGYSLAGNTQYWIATGYKEAANDGTTGLLSTVSNSGDPGSVFTVSSPPGFAVSFNNGISFGDILTAQNFVFSLQGTVVPEPSAAVLGLAGALVFFSRRLRQTRNAKPSIARVAVS